MIHLLIGTLAFMVIFSLAIAAKPCRRNCGGVEVPYPFGLFGDQERYCHFNESYAVNCSSNGTHEVPYLGETIIQITRNISLVDHELRVLADVASDCYGASGYMRNISSLRVSRFPISGNKNVFTAFGCDTQALLNSEITPQNSTSGFEDVYSTGCSTTCSHLESVVNGSCSGIGCCQTKIPKNAYTSQIRVTSFYNHSYVRDFNNCSYAFVAANDFFNFSAMYLSNFPDENVPLVLDWSVGNGTCDDASKNMKTHMCKEKSNCSDADNGTGYRCSCSDGYRGNPYLSGDGGCQDIDECVSKTFPCVENAKCVNTEGNFTCLCRKGYEGDGRNNGTGCRKKSPKTNAIAIGTTSGIAGPFLIILGWWLNKIIKKRQETKLKKKYFEQNGGLLLQQQLYSIEGTSKVFTSKELDKATNNFNANRILGQGGQGTVYKGMLVDGSIVAIKKSKIEDQTKLQQFINEVAILSQIGHRNIVKLLGCCLETEVPLLVYEFIPNGTLYQYLHNPIEEFAFSWDIRLRISTEIAYALSYLHFAAATPIYHRDIKSSNILLDERYRAKIADFGTSKSVAIDQTHITTMVQGTFGYLDPEYFQSSQLTDKSDVYSFGIVLVELLTRQKVVASARESEFKSLATYFLHSLANDYFLDIVDLQLLKEGVTKEIRKVAYVAKRCLNLNGNDRPSMKEVAMELEGLRKLRAHGLKEGKQGENEYEEMVKLHDFRDVESSKGTSLSDDQPLLSIKTM